MWCHLLVNILMPDILVNRLMVFTRKIVLAMDFYEQNDSNVALLIANKSRISGFIRHVSLENIT